MSYHSSIVRQRSLPGRFFSLSYVLHTAACPSVAVRSGGLAQLARAPALQAGGQRFESVILHVCSLEHEIFDILTHKTVSKDFKLKTELYISITSQFTAESMSYANA